MIEVDWNTDVSQLPFNKKVIIKYQDNDLDICIICQDQKDNFIINGFSYDSLSIIKAWSTLEEKPKEKGSRVYLDFSESELEELQELLNMTQDYIDRNDLQDWKEKEKRVKKFQDKFSKVEF